MLIKVSESSILYASLSLCQTLFTLSAGRSHSEGWQIDLNTRQRGLCGRETKTGTDRGSYRETEWERESWTQMQSWCTWLTFKYLHTFSSQSSEGTWGHWFQMVRPQIKAVWPHGGSFLALTNTKPLQKKKKNVQVWCFTYLVVHG